MPDRPPPPPSARPARAELVWEGKYDQDGRRVAPLRVALPFQTVETVNESAQERQLSLLRETGSPYAVKEWRNRLIWGDKKYVLPSLLPEFAGKVNLIYIDPPFDTGADFSFTATVPDHPDTPEDDSFSFTKEPSIIEHKAYRDTWGRGLDSYLQWFYETAVLLHELLHETGSLFVHLDWHVVHYAKCVLDEVFGPALFQNQIVWPRTNPQKTRKGFGRVHDVLLLYAKTDEFTWNPQLRPLSEKHLQRHYRRQDKHGRKYDVAELTAPGTTKGPSGQPWRGFDVAALGRHWRYSPDTLDELDKAGRIYWPSKGGFPRLIRYLDEVTGTTVGDVWDDISPLNMVAKERIDYPTQKPEALLERIIKASSNPGDLVLDCFVGSGTTAAVAEKLGRRWIACDLSRFAIHTTRKRLLAIPDVRPFVVQNLGKYERQAWQAQTFPGGAGNLPAPVGNLPTGSATNSGNGMTSDSQAASGSGAARQVAAPDGLVARSTHAEAAARQRAYIEFILQLYHATPVRGYTWLHGVRAGRMVHVGAVDAPVSVGDVTNIAAEFRKAIGTGRDAPRTNGVDVLGWDFAFELNEVAKQQAAAANIQMRFLRIPRDVMDKRAVEQGDVRFFELAALAVEVKTREREVTLRLTDFVIPPDDVPEEARRAVKHWSQWIDYWAVDWDNQGDTFHNQWQTYRARKNPKLSLETTHIYTAPGDYTVVVKVIDILGNDTTKTVKVRVK